MGIGASVFLLAAGAILAFAVDVPSDGINLDTVGVILILLGLLGLLFSLIWWNDWTPRRPVAYEDEDIVVRRRQPRVVAVDQPEDGVVDVDLVEERPVVERRRVTTRRTSYGGF